MGRGKWFYFLAICIVLPACNYTNSKVSPVAATTWFGRIDQSVIAPHCASCHSGSTAAKRLDFSSYDSVIASKTIVPFKPELSSFLTQIQSGKMPKGMPKLAPELALSIEQWILAGAPLDGPALAPPVVEEPPEATYAWLMPKVFTPYCLRCHNEKVHKGDFDMSTYEVMMDSNNIAPGSAEDSRFWRKIDSGSMPPESAVPLPEKFKEIIFKWIENGAKQTEDGK